MKTIGLLGGMSWQSSIEYERLINEEASRRLGGVASADLVIRSFNFADIEALQSAGQWDAAALILAGAAADLERSGAKLVVLATNTMHRLAPEIEAAIGVPLLHIADPTAAAVKAAGLGVVGLLGTRYTMEADFYAGRLRDLHGLTVLVPDAPSRDLVHRIIYDELVRGVVVPASKAAYLEVIDELLLAGAEGIVAGCTEIELLVTADDVAVPYFPTARLHALAAVDAALAVDEGAADEVVFEPVRESGS